MDGALGIFLRRCEMFDLYHLPINFISIYRKTPLVLQESNSYSLNLIDEIKQNMIANNCLGSKGQK